MTHQTDNATVKVYRVPRVIGTWIPVREEHATLDPDTESAAGELAAAVAGAEPVPAGHQARVTVTRDADPASYVVVSGPWAPNSPVRELETEPVSIPAPVEGGR
jgi:hypothetical protein